MFFINDKTKQSHQLKPQGEKVSSATQKEKHSPKQDVESTDRMDDLLVRLLAQLGE